MHSAALTRWQARLSLGLLLAPALLWLAALIVLPHVDLAVLSFRARVGPRDYVASLAQYKTFFMEPLYWHVFVRTGRHQNPRDQDCRPHHAFPEA